MFGIHEYVINKICFYVVIGASFYYFIALCPGLFVNFFPPTDEKCAKLVPLPNITITKDCSTQLPDLPDVPIRPICDARAVCGQFFQSGYTAPSNVLVQGFAFALLLIFFTYFVYEWNISTLRMFKYARR